MKHLENTNQSKAKINLVTTEMYDDEADITMTIDFTVKHEVLPDLIKELKHTLEKYAN